MNHMLLYIITQNKWIMANRVANASFNVNRGDKHAKGHSPDRP